MSPAQRHHKSISLSGVICIYLPDPTVSDSRHRTTLSTQIGLCGLRSLWMLTGCDTPHPGPNPVADPVSSTGRGTDAVCITTWSAHTDPVRSALGVTLRCCRTRQVRHCPAPAAGRGARLDAVHCVGTQSRRLRVAPRRVHPVADPVLDVLCQCVSQRGVRTPLCDPDHRVQSCPRLGSSPRTAATRQVSRCSSFVTE